MISYGLAHWISHNWFQLVVWAVVIWAWLKFTAWLSKHIGF